MEDADLLRLYVFERSESAFGEFVKRHVDLVYSAAFRQTGGNHHKAQEVTQMVFESLARKAASLLKHPALEAWLYRSARLSSADLFRREARRRQKEHAAALDAAILADTQPQDGWERVKPVLDAEMNSLGERDREAIVLRYFANRPFADVGRRLGLSENAARMRVERALDKLRERLAKRGIESTGAALATILATEAVSAAPAGVALSAASVGAVAAGSSSAVLLFMSAHKLTLGVIGMVAAIGAGTLTVQVRANQRLAKQIALVQERNADLPSLRQENVKRAKAQADIEEMKSEVRNGQPLLAEQAELRKQLADYRSQIAAKVRSREKVQITGPILSASQLDSQPTAISQSRPNYPDAMREAGKSGQVMVDFIVDSKGNVQNAYAANSSNKEFEQAAVDAVSQWGFDPGQKAGRVVNTHMQMAIVFTINNDEDNTPPSPTAPAVATSEPFTVQQGQPQPEEPSPSSWFPDKKG